MSIQLSPLHLLPALLAVAGSSLALSASEGAGAARPQATFIEIPGQRELSGRMIVRPRQLASWIDEGVPAAEATARVAAARDLALQATVIRYVPQTDEYIIGVAPGESEEGTARALLDTGLFQYAEPDWVVYPVGAPDDPGYPSQWHHWSTRMQSADGWDIHSGGPSVGVAICDTGILTTHEDFALHRLEGYNAVDLLWESQGGDVGPVAGHGTLTSGAAAANGDNGKGIAGVGLNLGHRMMRVSNASSGGAFLSDIQHGARTAIEAGDRVANASYSGVDNASNLTTASYIKSIGGLMFWAAGNDARDLTFLDRDADDLIVVGATDSGDVRAGFSAYGMFVDLTAPGVSIYTTSAGSNSDYGGASGTSLSTPLAAGLAGLIWSYNPTLTPDEVEAALKAGCEDLGAGGVDDTYGYGRINVLESLLAAGPPCPGPTTYCSTSPNSFGPGARIDSSGTTSVAAADLQLAASGCPPGVLGLFFYGDVETSLPFGNGVRCVGGSPSTYRFPPVVVDSLGLAMLDVDFGAPPAGSGAGALLPGSTWKFQFWYRDPKAGGAGYNLSDGLSVPFCP
jgi:subtilisin family serine protease